MKSSLIFYADWIIDSFLRSRKSDDHECTSTIKTQFMTLWDGLTTSQTENRILVVGATNRPEDVDAAILRRKIYFIDKKKLQVPI